MEFRGSCQDLREAGLDIGSCCESCHVDMDYGCDLIQLMTGDATDYVDVCCRVADDVETDQLAAFFAKFKSEDQKEG